MVVDRVNHHIIAEQLEVGGLVWSDTDGPRKATVESVHPPPPPFNLSVGLANRGPMDPPTRDARLLPRQDVQSIFESDLRATHFEVGNLRHNRGEIWQADVRETRGPGHQDRAWRRGRCCPELRARLTQPEEDRLS